jgi:hypothetical protein
MSSRMRSIVLGVGGVLVACASGEGAPAARSFNSDKAPPPNPCPAAPSPVATDAPTPFGAAPPALLERLELGATTPFVWGPYEKERSSGDQGPSTTTYDPGPSEARLTLGVGLRESEDVLQTVYPRDVGSRCPDDTLDVPVATSLVTDDGALDERFDAQLVFTSANTARLEAELPAERLAGSLAFDSIAAPAVGWRAAAFTVFAELWPGGSRGSVVPRFAYEGPLMEASPPVLPARPEPQLAEPEPLTRWGLLAMWPQALVCSGDVRGFNVPVDADARVIGWSARDIVAELDTRAVRAIDVDGSNLRVRFTLEPPSGVHCMRSEGRNLTFAVEGHVAVEAAPEGSPLEHLDARSAFLISARVSVDGAALEQLSWVRQGVDGSQTLAEFAASTGIAVAATPDARSYLWSWIGSDRRVGSGGALSSRTEFRVHADAMPARPGNPSVGSPALNADVGEDGSLLVPGEALWVFVGG